ncbi:MAG: hypothetical protein FWD73_13860 [Polyangiaceae bacterium]|nr:hypothetical protein [Polyangiaceae bacterium]
MTPQITFWGAARLVRTATYAALLVALTACGKSNADSSVLKYQIATLESNGTLPKLDRSSDVAGIDTNGNDVRDDIEAWIDAQPVTDMQKTALMQNARALQHTLTVDLTDQAALGSVGAEIVAAIHCGVSRFSTFADFYKYSQNLEAITANTKNRAVRYIQYNNARSGAVNSTPDYDTCTP